MARAAARAYSAEQEVSRLTAEVARLAARASTPGGDRVAARPADASHKTHKTNATTPPRPVDASRAARGVKRARAFDVKVFGVDPR